MTRRMALAVALAFTTMVTFSVVVFGAQHGVFSDPKKPAQQAVVDPPVDTPEPEATATEVLPPTPLPPIVITKYVYIDDPAPIAASAVQPAATATQPAAPITVPTLEASPTAPATPTKVPPTAAPRSAPATSEPPEAEGDD